MRAAVFHCRCVSRALLPALLAGGLLWLITAGPATGQEATETSESEPDSTPESATETAAPASEFVVVGKRPDEEARAEQLYADMLREQMYEEIERLRKEEELAWRETDLTVKAGEDARITFGYDPVEEKNLRELTDINEMPGETVKPATLFRTKF